MLPRPRFRLPLWAAVAIVAAAYFIRAVVRGWEFRLDWPADAVALALFAVVVGIVAYVRHAATSDDEESQNDRPASQNDDGPPAP